ncbi:hypothetical protein [Streptococcus varani]|uniref:hypothetical protein n=1 Tax=Streptococcus varani TaxID=1608583 RepID=UPI00159EEBD6|nr:hypothetical protein [Streptococcus varani]
MRIENQARCALIFYPHIDEAYLGYFESNEHPQLVLLLFEKMKDLAKKHGKKALLGPINASFWLGYRMKTSGYQEKIFSGEPHNPSYYPRLWEQAGFQVSDAYISNFYSRIEANHQQEKMAKRYNSFRDKGYKIFSPKRKDWDHYAPQVFQLLSQLYKEFPSYQAITRKEFAHIFSPLKIALDFSMVKLAYYQEELVGFLICLPDYGNLTDKKMSPLDICHFFKIRYRAKRYILLYLGVAPDHLGLGNALGFPVYQTIQKRRALSIGALIHKGKVSQSYASELQEKRRSYALYRLEL